MEGSEIKSVMAMTIRELAATDYSLSSLSLASDLFFNSRQKDRQELIGAKTVEKSKNAGFRPAL